jgi:hypothetical protein
VALTSPFRPARDRDGSVIQPMTLAVDREPQKPDVGGGNAGLIDEAQAGCATPALRAGFACVRLLLGRVFKRRSRASGLTLSEHARPVRRSLKETVGCRQSRTTSASPLAYKSQMRRSALMSRTAGPHPSCASKASPCSCDGWKMIPDVTFHILSNGGLHADRRSTMKPSLSALLYEHD